MTELNCIRENRVRKRTIENSVCADYLGLQSYADVTEIQNQACEKIRGTLAIHIWGMEFQPVITMGIRGNQSLDLIRPPSEVPIPVVQTDRGGQATLHSPGQLVIYPSMDLKEHGFGVRDFVCVVIKATSALLKSYGIESQSGSAPGLYTQQGKIAFLGIRVDRGVVKHGLALNVTNELPIFNYIKSCGVSQATLDKMQNYPHTSSLDLNQLFQKWVVEFEKALQSY